MPSSRPSYRSTFFLQSEPKRFFHSLPQTKLSTASRRLGFRVLPRGSFSIFLLPRAYFFCELPQSNPRTFFNVLREPQCCGNGSLHSRPMWFEGSLKTMPSASLTLPEGIATLNLMCEPQSNTRASMCISRAASAVAQASVRREPQFEGEGSPLPPWPKNGKVTAVGTSTVCAVLGWGLHGWEGGRQAPC